MISSTFCHIFPNLFIWPHFRTLYKTHTTHTVVGSTDSDSCPYIHRTTYSLNNENIITFFVVVPSNSQPTIPATYIIPFRKKKTENALLCWEKNIQIINSVRLCEGICLMVSLYKYTFWHRHTHLCTKIQSSFGLCGLVWSLWMQRQTIYIFGVVYMNGRYGRILIFPPFLLLPPTIIITKGCRKIITAWIFFLYLFLLYGYKTVGWIGSSCSCYGEVDQKYEEEQELKIQKKKIYDVICFSAFYISERAIKIFCCSFFLILLLVVVIFFFF